MPFPSQPKSVLPHRDSEPRRSGDTVRNGRFSASPKIDPDNVPASACRLAAGAFRFALDEPDESGRIPVRMVARSGKPIDHWYWGPNTIHDLSGMFIPGDRDRVPVDWLHDDNAILGYLDQFRTDSGDLEASGALVPFDEGDKVAEIAHKARAGVPYEASIDFGGDGIRIEELDSGTAEVNGYTVQGPATIFRAWPLRGVAICPHGADALTSTQLADAQRVRVTLLSKETAPMTTPDRSEARGLLARLMALFAFSPADLAAEAPPASDSAGEVPSEPDPAGEVPPASDSAGEAPSEPDPAPDPTEQARAELARYVEAFGDQGMHYWREGKTFADAAVAHARALEAQLAEAQKRLAAVDRGEDQPAEFSDEQEPDRQIAGRQHGHLAGLVQRNAAALARHRQR